MSAPGQGPPGRPLQKVVTGVQFFAASAALAFVVLLFVNEPDQGGATGGPAGGGIDGAAVFADRCAGCHGADAGGGRGPQLSEGLAEVRFPNIEDQIAVVTDGRNGMPGFGGQLTPEEIEAVVEYTRTL